MIHVFLDDFRPCPQGFVLARNAEECKQLIDAEPIGILSLDYDLGWNEPTGYEVVCHLVERAKYPEQVYLHTSSAAGRIQMYHLLSTHAPMHVKLFNGPMPSAVLEEIAKRK
ncbi:cyclic-phosphate processing receiver domain-containing protein [Paenibacillus sp. NEAU-GSW1]|uniref:cyclic-phosphate processing receiver domain-containing protein n=1 Tax=Paenibacillus sp. NEAU-GSW1 TaxID=2682486 RepID=UPI0012E25222|nr:cyclic-phosphate processing receiver domain-containing protein [Paenibacillus sp. NEAU-GSW1]MUT67333.1 cell division protein FtsJ [Paenibacillus sp. NEAU-GSW1]